jgi:putative two-component system response regulator
MTFCLESSAWNFIKTVCIKESKNMDKRQRVLIVDDAKLNRDILKEILGETYNYLEAENGNQAVQMLGENIGIDLMFLG